MDREFSEELTGLMPVVRHRLSGAECSGRIVAVVESGTVELRCNECGAVVGVVEVGIMEGLLGWDGQEETCPHCGAVNTLSELDGTATFVCEQCGKRVDTTCE